jgi:hypothetical protein
MKAKTVITVLMLICWFALTPGLLRAEENQWYQGQQGKWAGNRWESTHGDEWFQGRQGHWYQERDGLQWRGNDGDEYRQGQTGWQWQKHDQDR